MSVHYEFKWPKGPEDVIVTGTFDDWSQSLPLVKQVDGSFAIQVPLPPKKETIFYKYVVDGEWKVNTSEKVTKDFEGNDNNILEAEDLVHLLVVPGALIPESGLVTNTTNNQKNLNYDDDYKTTVLPKEEPHHSTISGEPGIYVPRGGEDVSAFDNYEDTDARAKELNADVKEVGTANAPTTQETNEQQLGSTDPTTVDPIFVAETTAIVDPSSGIVVEDTEISEIAPVSKDAEPQTEGLNSKGLDSSTASSSAGLTADDKEKQKKKVKRTKYKAKKKAKAAALANGTTPNGEDEEIDEEDVYEDEEIVPEAEPVLIATGNDETSADYLGNQPKVTRQSLAEESKENTELNKEVRDEFEDPKAKKEDHSTAKTLGAAALGGVGGAGLGAGLSSELASDSYKAGADQGKEDVSATGFGQAKDNVNGPFSTSKEARNSISPDQAKKPSLVDGVVDDKHPKTLDPRSGSQAPAPGTTAPGTLASNPVVPPVTGSNIDSSEGKEVNASPVAKQPIPTIDDNQEEEIIIAQGNRKDILAAVEATEGPNVELEEIKPSKSEQEKLTKEAQLAAQVDGPITIEQVKVPESKVHPNDTTSKTPATVTASKATPATAKDVPIKSKDDKTTPKAGTKSTTTKQTPSKQTPAKKTAANGTKQEEKKGFRGFLKKVFS
ncbi:CRP1 [Candida jiufengensis]|uniref:CRP1 n=1 Tax=Candida jiufengensis TaxID=497108 RepID=UPI0022255A69|nr:CRP1 [Candida jiufengensis]KAI5954389.1 CRP1 [Candida jiufengensis]